MHPATATLNRISVDYKDQWHQVDNLRQARGKPGVGDWPARCFLPIAGWRAITEMVNVDPIMASFDATYLAALGAWRYSMGIYSFDPDLAAALAESEIKGNLPSEVLCRLPEWCIYVEAPGLTWQGFPVIGFWAHLEWDSNRPGDEEELCLLILTNQQPKHDFDHTAPLPLALHLGASNLSEAVEQSMQLSLKNAAQFLGQTMAYSKSQIASDTDEAMAMLSLLLYLCSDEPEIDDLRQPGSHPERPRPKKTKRGWKLFPAKGARLWSVGKETGEALRSAKAGQSHPHKGPAPHLRRAHWHGYWTGPKATGQRFSYRWINPILVSGDD